MAEQADLPPDAGPVPEVSFYRVSLARFPRLQHVVPGTAIIEPHPTSIISQVWRNIVGVLIRESGF